MSVVYSVHMVWRSAKNILQKAGWKCFLDTTVVLIEKHISLYLVCFCCLLGNKSQTCTSNTETQRIQRRRSSDQGWLSGYDKTVSGEISLITIFVLQIFKKKSSVSCSNLVDEMNDHQMFWEQPIPKN